MDSFANWLSAAAPDIPAAEALALARRHYGLEAEATELYAERDRNYRLTTADGQRYVLKIANADISAERVAFQNRVLSHVAVADPGLPTPRVVATGDGRQQFAWTSATGSEHQVRLLTWLEGECTVLHKTDAPLREWLGRDLARLGQALRDCDPRGAPRNLPWDLRNTGKLEALSTVAGSTALQRQVRATLERFERWLQPALTELPSQLIHNDLNPDNVLFDHARPRRVSGFIDFGDMVCAPLVCDLAVACTYQLGERGPDPLDELLPMARGYCAVQPLAARELALLPGLVECRLLMTLLIQGWRARAQLGDDLEEILANSDQAAERLMRFSGLDHTAAGERLVNACGVR